MMCVLHAFANARLQETNHLYPKIKFMKFTRFSLLLLCFVASSFAGAAQSIYMKVSDPSQINGESTAALFPNWTEITAFNAGATFQPPGSFGGGATGPAVPKCFTISMLQDKMAYYLKRKQFFGTTLASLQLDFTKSTQTASVIYYRVQMENVYITAVEEAASTSNSGITINVSFVPEKFRYTYWPQNSAGALGTPVIFGWNVTTNQTW